MGLMEDLRAELGQINATTNELAADVDEMIVLIGQGTLTPADQQELRDGLTTLKTSLQSVASKWPTPPPIPT